MIYFWVKMKLMDRAFVSLQIIITSQDKWFCFDNPIKIHGLFIHKAINVHNFGIIPRNVHVLSVNFKKCQHAQHSWFSYRQGMVHCGTLWLPQTVLDSAKESPTSASLPSPRVRYSPIFSVPDTHRYSMLYLPDHYGCSSRCRYKTRGNLPH